MQELSPIGWALRPIKHYADFSGRAPRAEYWWYVLGASVVGLLLGFVDRVLLGGPVYGNYGPLGLAFGLAIIVPGVAVSARRMHDTDHSGWWCLFKAAGYIFWLAAPFSMRQIESVAAAMSPSLSNIVLSIFFIALAVFLCAAVAFFIFLVTRGTEGPNRYGPNPYGPDELEEVFA